MSEATKTNLKRALGILLAAALVITVGFAARNSLLKADEEAPESEVIQEPSDVVIEQEPEAEPVPVEDPALVTEEINISDVEPAALEAPAEQLDEEAASEDTDNNSEFIIPNSELDEAPEIDTSKMSLRVWDDRKDQMSEGQTVTLHSELKGFEGISYTYRWQCNKGSGWEDIPDANEATYSFTADTETLSWSWRLLIDY